MGWKLHFSWLAKIIFPHWLGGVNRRERSGTWQEWWDGFRKGKSGLAVQGRAEGDRNSGKEQRLGRRDAPGWGLFYTFYICNQRNLPPGSLQANLPSNVKGNKKQITLKSHKVVLKHKPVCLAKSCLSFVASLDPKLPDCGMTRRGVLGGKGSGACVINCSSASLFPWRILQETTGPTGWPWPSWSLLSSPSCLCSSKVIPRECTGRASDE